MLIIKWRSGGRTGFTLIETVIVAVIVALLAAILLPSLSRARAQTRSAQCLSNLHQLQAAALIYSSQNRGLIPGYSEPNRPSWATQLARQVGLRFSGSNLPVDQFAVARCPERGSGQESPFVDYVANAMNPQGPAPDGSWTKMHYLRDEARKRSSKIIYLADAEREDKVVHIAGHPGGDTVKDAHANWSAGRFDQGTFGSMTVWTGSHLPEGKDCVNVTDESGVRRAARKLHMDRYTNASFLDGHAAGETPGGWPEDSDNYGVWLSRFGVKDQEAASVVPIQ